MKKHDEGYVLVYVTVVLLVFCLVATTILTGALNNLRNQQNAIAKMEDQYAAAGEIEKVIAQWSAYNWDSIQVSGSETKSYLPNTAVECLGKDGGTVTIRAESGTVSITCQIEVSTGKYLSYEIGGVGE